MYTVKGDDKATNLFEFMAANTNVNWSQTLKTYQEKDFLTLYHIINDSFTILNYWYIKDNFVFKGRSSSCD